jgi:hypothetical protein
MRVRVIAPGLQLMQTAEKWGCQRLAGRGVLGMCAVHDYLAGEPIDAFVAGCNYLLAPACPDDRLFRAAAEQLAGEAAILSRGEQRALCLRTPRLYGRARRTWKATSLHYLEDPLAMLADVLVRAERHLHGKTTELISGLWTAEHGFVHTGRVTLSLRTAWDGEITWEAIGAHNLLEAPWNGPYAGLVSLQSHQKPVRVALPPFPFQP